MAKDQTVAVAADVLKADAAALAALAKIAGYTPANAEFALTKLQTASAATKAAADALLRARRPAGRGLPALPKNQAAPGKTGAALLF